MSHSTAIEVAYRLATLETSIYRSRSDQLRLVAAEQARLLRAVQHSFATIANQTDARHHRLAHELRAIRRYCDSGGELTDLDSLLSDLQRRVESIASMQ